MRKDYCHYFDKNLQEVFYAYQQAIKSKFGKDADASPFHTLSFSIGFSFKYNMNGGSCHVHLMPYSNGTAIDVRYSIAQLAMARCSAHDKDLTVAVERILGTSAQPIELDEELFMKNKESGTAQCSLNQPMQNPSLQPQMQPVQRETPPVSHTQAPAFAQGQSRAMSSTPAQSGLGRFCVNCGTRFDGDAKFCIKCGTKRQ
ncbi:MAG: zinc ribbon domain-containing protein [Clostridia bacterium]|nr:zinc ribbon domain-containing protein [Clostridia bacterium]